MKMLLFMLLAALSSLSFTNAQTASPPVIQTNASYVIYAPRTYHRYVDYDIYIIICIHVDVDITIFINSRNSTTAVVNQGKSLIISLSGKEFPRRWSNILRVVGIIAGTNYTLINDTRRIHRSYSGPQKENTAAMFIQKDKPFYKPTDKVRFCCFGLNDKLKTILRPMNVRIYDPKGNLMEYWANETSRTGVVTKRFQLSDKPVLGNWRIRCSQIYDKPFEKSEYFPVGEYVLPPIKVTLDGDKYIYHLGCPAFYLAKHYIDIIVNARYSFGAPVKGRVIIRITINEWQQISFQRVFPINGKLVYRFYLSYFFSVNKIIKIYRYAGMPSYISLTVVAKVIEDETDLDIMSAPMIIRLGRAPVDIVSPYSVYIKPGLTKQFQLQIKRVDGQPLKWEDVKQKLRITFIKGTQKRSTLVYIPLDGIVVIPLPGRNYTRVRIDYYGCYQNVKYILCRYIYLYVYFSPGPYHLTVSLKKTHCFAGDLLCILIQSTTALKKCYYVIHKNTRFIDSGFVYVFGSETAVSIKSSKSWMPYIKIIVTCFTIDSNVLVDILPIKLCTDFKYKVTGMYSPGKNSAGKKTLLKMASAPYSTLFIMAVDERLEFLKKPNYISKDSIMNAFNRRSPISVPSYVHDTSSLLNWCRLTWMSNRIRSRYYGRRHPMHMAMHMMSHAKGAFSVKVRDEFPEVWIWKKVLVGPGGCTQIPLTTPDSITNWITHALAVHPISGISILENPLEFLSFQKMFLILNLPYCVIRNERLIINVIVFNYLSTPQKILVQLKNTGLIYQDKHTKITEVGAKSYKGVKFSIRPSNVGDVPIELDLHVMDRKNFTLVDRLVKILKVKPEGRTVYFSREYQAQVKNSTTRFVISIHIPSVGVVPNSERIEICVTGDIMGPVIEGLGKLVRLPSGCGEQTASSLVPNVYIYSYLKVRNALDNDLRKKLISYTKSGVQNQLRYQKPDGSYSAFQSTPQGSVWLTAFILKSFQEIIRSGMPVFIDKGKIRLSLRWLLSKQNPNGSFIETGRVIHKNMQGGSSGGVPLTAYVMKVLMSLTRHDPLGIINAMNKAHVCLSHMDFTKMDVYTLCILLCTYSKFSDKKKFQELENLLLPNAIVVNGMMYWKGKYDIEQTAYVLLAYAHKKDIPKGKQILKWLLSKRNSLGGYSNTQNTVVALEAITEFSLLLKQTSNLIVKISYNNWNHTFKPITAQNKFVVQKKTVPNNARRILVTATGDGTAYVTAVWQYNVYKEMDDRFGLSVVVNTTLGKRLIIVICFRWTKRTSPGMIVSSVQLPSGFQVQSVGCKDRNCIRYQNCTTTENCMSKNEVEKDKVNLYLGDMKYNWAVYIVLILRRVHVVDNKDTNLYIRSTAYYDGGQSEVAYNPFNNLLPDKFPW